MDPLYIVDFEVTGANGDTVLSPADVFERLLDHVADWLNWDTTTPVDRESLSRHGNAEQQIHRLGRDLTRRVRWRSRGTDEVQAFRCQTTQDLAGSASGTFVCEVTLFRDPDLAALRIELGRETVQGLLTPSPVSSVRRPYVLSNVLRDKTLVCRSQGQVVDGRFQWINLGQAALLEDALAHVPRLPLLLVDGRHEEARTFAGFAAPHLAGLTQVVVIDGQALGMLRSHLEEIEADIPDNGARLVWPTSGWRNPAFTDWQLLDRDRALSTLLKMVTTASVAARGGNRYVRRGVEAAQRRREETFRKDLAEAQAAGDLSSTVQTLNARITELMGDNEVWLNEIERWRPRTNNSAVRSPRRSTGRNSPSSHSTRWQAPAGPTGKTHRRSPLTASTSWPAFSRRFPTVLSSSRPRRRGAGNEPSTRTSIVCVRASYAWHRPRPSGGPPAARPAAW